MGKLSYFKQIAGDPGHDLAGLVVVIEPVGQPLQMGKQILSHVGLHSDTDDVTVVLHKIPKQHPDHIKHQHDHTGDHNGRVHFIGNVVVEHFVGDHRIHHADHGDQQGGQHVQSQQLPVGLVINKKSFQHSISFLIRRWDS